MRINHASADPRFRAHPGLALHGIESYLAVPLIRRDGRPFGTLCTLDPRPAALGDDAFAIFHLLADLIAFELEADERQREREAQIRALEDVIAIAGHDLRQPLTVLLGELQLLARQVRREGAAPAVAARVDGLIAQARRASALSGTLLDVARLESGGLALDRADFDLAALARQTLADVRAVAPQHTFRLEAPAALPFHGDERRLGQVLRNLLENAAKYAPADSGPVVLTLAPHPPGGAAAGVEITVGDAGPGVAEDQRARLFDRHYRVPEAVEWGIPGSGLGLYIVRRIVEAHRGAARAERAPTGGLLVRLTLPAG